MPTSEILEQQANDVEALLAQHGIPARITGGTAAPRWTRFLFADVPDSQVDAIRALQHELAQACGVERCRVARRGRAAALELLRAEPESVQLLPLWQACRSNPFLAGETGSGLPAYTVPLGIADDGAPLLLQLGQQAPHVLVAGGAGSGKSVLLRTIVTGLALRHPRSALLCLLVDLGLRALADFENYPQLVGPPVADIDQVPQALETLLRLVERRSRQTGSHVPRVVIVIDELAGLLSAGGGQVERALVELTQRGHGVGLHVVAATAQPGDCARLLDQAHFPVRLVGRCDGLAQARAASGRLGSGAERLDGRGDFVAVAEGQVRRFQAAAVPPETIRQIGRFMSGRHDPAAAQPPWTVVPEESCSVYASSRGRRSAVPFPVLA